MIYQVSDLILWHLVKRKYLSLTALDEALRDATSAELSQLQRDFGLLAGIARQVFSVMPKFPADFPHKYGLLTFAGRLVVMFDLAFRRASYGPNIDYFLSMASSIEEEASERVMSGKT